MASTTPFLLKVGLLLGGIVNDTSCYGFFVVFGHIGLDTLCCAAQTKYRHPAVSAPINFALYRTKKEPFFFLSSNNKSVNNLSQLKWLV